jgi:endoglycosylceramidase
MLSRPYPRAIAGTPVSFAFHSDRKDRKFTLTYRTNPRIHAPTVLFVPPMHYPRGYRVKVSGPARVTSRRGARLVTLRSTGPGRVRVTLTR